MYYILKFWFLTATAFYQCFCLDEGPNVCAMQETYVTMVQVSYTKPYQIREYTWCHAFPPRCSKYRIGYTTDYRTGPKIETRTINTCCKGFVLTADESKCIPFCSDPCIHGSCVKPGECECQPGFEGPTCNIPLCSDPCIYGSCIKPGECECLPGFEGPTCISPCPEGKFGPQCKEICICKNNASCDPVTGECSCKPGWQSDDCSLPCDDGYYGHQCKQECYCQNGASCAPITGNCTCIAGYYGSSCENKTDEEKNDFKVQSNCSSENEVPGPHVTPYCVCKLDMQPLLPLDCEDLHNNGENKSGVYWVWPKNRVISGPISVYCDMETDGGGWTVIQRRGNFHRSADYFSQDWKAYKEGFGNLKEDFWLGNENIYALSNQKLYSIRFDLGDTEGNKSYATYNTFWIDNENDNYTLHVTGYSGDAGDSFSSHSGYKFSTQDRDTEIDNIKCAEIYKGGWWFSTCFKAYLNGEYRVGKSEEQWQGAIWNTWKGSYESLATSEMKIRKIPSWIK